MAKPYVNEYVESHRLNVDFAVERLILEFMGAIHRQMEESNVTQEEMAQRMGVTQARVSQMLDFTGNVTVRTLGRAACALGCEWTEIKLSPVAEPDMSKEVKSLTEVNIKASTASAKKSVNKEIPDDLPIAV